MVSMTLAIPIELKKEMELYPEINWSVVARTAIQRKIKILQEMDKLLSKSELTEEDTIRIGRQINKKVAKKYREEGWMEVIIDANIFVAALLKKGVTRKLLLNDELVLYTPEYVIEEIFDHLQEFETKSHLSRISLEELVKVLIIESKMNIIPKDELRPFIKKADEITPDPDDVMYFAAALKQNIGIWSNDKEMKKQKVINVYSTNDLIKLFEFV
jgi:predicted nucleic acid-binding protein